MAQFQRQKTVHTINFAASATVSSNFLEIQDASAVMFIFPAEFNTDTITVRSRLSGDAGFSFTAATGAYVPKGDELAEIFARPNIELVTNTATAAAATVTVVKCT
jgi:hypothetical protein